MDFAPVAAGSQHDAAQAAAAVVADLDGGPGWRAAAAELVDLARAGSGSRPLVLLATRLAADADEAVADLEVGRDLPRRQRLSHLADLLVGLPVAERHRLRPTLQAVAAALGSDRALLGVQQQLRIAALDWRKPAEVRRALLQAAGQCATRPLQAAALAGLVRSSLDADPGAWQPDPLLGLATELANRAGVAGGLLAVEVAAAAGPRRGWDDRWRAYLRSLRWHPDPDVASAARAVVMAPE